MASIIERQGRFRALVRKGGFSKCATFSTEADAKRWAAKIESQVDEIRSTGVMRAGAATIADLIDRYVREIKPIKKWGRSKDADLARLRRDVGSLKAATLTTAHLTAYFSKRRREGAGGVVVNAQLGYLIGVLSTARSLWQLDVPVAAAETARDALSRAGMVGKSDRRDRRVSDDEIQALQDYFATSASRVPMADIVAFCVATSMRISEVCRLRWADLDVQKRTIVIRDRKHPTDKWGNDATVPLLDATGQDAFAIVMRQRRGRSERIFPFLDRTVGTYVTRAVASLGIEDLHLHDLRHEAISRVFAAGFRIEQVALISGHRDWAMLKRYTHVRAEDLHAVTRPAAGEAAIAPTSAQAS
jgi:integrase